MRLLALVAVPLLAAGVAALPTRRFPSWRTSLLVATASVHTALVGSLWVAPATPMLNGWLAVDALGLVVLTVTTILFVLTSVYTVGYLARVPRRDGRAFVSGLLAFLAATSLVALSQHLAMLWVGMEATTLAVAPLIFHRHDRRALEAVWKYLLISSEPFSSRRLRPMSRVAHSS
jgi:hydrogenase-4 component F